MIEMIEEYGTFTPADSVDGLQMFDVAIDPAAMMEDVAAGMYWNGAMLTTSALLE